MDINSSRIDGTTLEGIELFEQALEEYAGRTKKHIERVRHIGGYTNSWWKDRQQEQAKSCTDDFLCLSRELAVLDELKHELARRKRALASALEILDSIERGM